MQPTKGSKASKKSGCVFAMGVVFNKVLGLTCFALRLS